MTLRVKLAQQSRCPRPKRSLAYPNNENDPRLLEFHQSFRTYFNPQPLPRPCAVTESLTVFTDGSGTSGRCNANTPAGWGWTSTRDFLEFLDSGGPVIVNPSIPGYLGASVGSNNTAELSAWIEAAIFLLATQLPRSVTFVYDSKWTANMITGKWRPKRHKSMIATARAIYQTLSAKTNVEWEWVKGHSGNMGNTRADALANRGKSSPAGFGGRYGLSPFPTPADFSLPAPVPSDANPPEVEAARLTEAVVHSANHCFTASQPKPRKPWITEGTLQLLRQARSALALNAQNAPVLWKEARKAARADKKRWVHQLLEQDHTPHKRNLWLTVRQQTKGFSARRTRLVRDGVVVPWFQTHIAFRDHYALDRWAPSTLSAARVESINSEVLRMGPSLPLAEISSVELSTAIDKLRKGKAPGHDDLTADMIKALDAYGELKLLNLLNLCLSKRRIPKEWKMAVVVSFYKGKGNDQDPASYRPISLLPVLYKLYATILQHRLASELDSYIRPTQYGFCSARGTRHALFLVRRIQDWSRALSKPMHMLFLDWKQAFDTLDHSALIKGLQRWNIHPGYIEIIQDFYTSPEFSIMGMNGQVATGAVSSGIRQGCPLSPYLFILILSLILEDTELRLIQQGTPTNTWSIGKPVFDVEYADDTLIFGISTPQLESMLQALEQEASKYGMSLNFAKSELLVSDAQSDAAMNFANGQPVPITTSVKYLGSVVTWDHPTETAIAARFSKARTALQSIRLVWNSRLPQTTKLYIFHSVVVSSLTYGLNCLTLAHKHFKLIDGYYFRLLRRVLGIPASYISRVSNFTVWQRAGKPTTASQIVLKQQTEILLSFGHSAARSISSRHF